MATARRVRLGDHMLVRVKRAGSVIKDIQIPLDQFTYVGYAPGSGAYIATILSRIVTPLFCLALGFWVAAVRVGEERLIEAVRAMQAAPPRAILEYVIKSADVFAAGTPQYDDMTLIVARSG